MARIEFAPGVLEDFARIVAHIENHGSTGAEARLDAIVLTLDVLESNPWIGREGNEGLRELVIGQGAQGYVALYAFLEEVDTVLVLALRSQREAAYTRP